MALPEYLRIKTIGNSREFYMADVPSLDDEKGQFFDEGKPTKKKANKGLVFKQKKGRGSQAGRLIGNTRSVLMLHRDAAQLAEDLCTGQQIERIPFELKNAEGKETLSTEFEIVNPIGTIEALNYGASEVFCFYKTGELWMSAIKPGIVLDPAKIPDGVHLFRIPEARRNYIMSKTLAQAIIEHDLAVNFGFDAVEVTETPADFDMDAWLLDRKLLSAAGDGNADVVQTLLNEGANIESIDGDGSTALRLAIDSSAGGADAAKVLIKAGADVNAPGEWGRTPLLQLTYKSWEEKAMCELFQMMLAAGGDASLEDDSGDSAASRIEEDEELAHLTALLA